MGDRRITAEGLLRLLDASSTPKHLGGAWSTVRTSTYRDSVRLLRPRLDGATAGMEIGRRHGAGSTDSARAARSNPCLGRGPTPTLRWPMCSDLWYPMVRRRLWACRHGQIDRPRLLAPPPFAPS